MKQTLLIITVLMLVVGCSSDGIQTYYYDNGQKSGEATWKDGKEIESTRWDRDGNKK